MVGLVHFYNRQECRLVNTEEDYECGGQGVASPIQGDGMGLKILALHILTAPQPPSLVDVSLTTTLYQDGALAGGATPLADPVPTNPGSAKAPTPADR